MLTFSPGELRAGSIIIDAAMPMQFLKQNRWMNDRNNNNEISLFLTFLVFKLNTLVRLKIREPIFL